MAWISVHEQVIGGKLRKLAKEIGCSQNEALGLLMRFWLWGFNNADKEGRIIGADKDDIAEVLTVGIDSRYSPKKAVDAMISTNWIDVDDYLYIHDWDEWQEQLYKAFEIREANARRKRLSRLEARLKKLVNDSEDTRNDDISVEIKSSLERVNELGKIDGIIGERIRNLVSILEKRITEEKVNANENEMKEVLPKPKLNIPQSEPQKQQPAASYPNDFEEMWKIYPRKVGKGEAYKKYKARLNDGWKPEELIEAAKNYARKVARERTEQQYIKHAKTFFSDSTPFTDFLPRKPDESPQISSGNDDDPYADWR